MRGNFLKVNDLVAREGVEPPTPAFSGLRSTDFFCFLDSQLVPQMNTKASHSPP